MITWPLFPNWKSRYVERYSYLTEILLSEAGREQRRSYRGSARRTLEYQALVQRDRFYAMRRTLTARQGETFVFPDEVRRIRASSGAASGSTTLSVASPPTWLEPGRVVILEDIPSRDREARTIDTVVSGVVTFIEPTARDWPTPPRVMPAWAGMLDPSIKVTMPTDRVGVVPVSLMVEPGGERETVDAAPVMFAGREVLAHRPNWANALQMESTDPTEFVDYEMGVRTAFRRIDFGTQVRQTNHLIRSAADLNATLGLFQRAQGRRGEFYAPTFVDDFSLASPVAGGAVDWTIPGTDFYAAYFGDTVHRAFAVRMMTGQVYYFRVSNVLLGSGVSILRTIETAPTTINPADVSSISWMPVSRFGSDDLTVSWVTDQTAEITLSVLTLEALA